LFGTAQTSAPSTTAKPSTTQEPLRNEFDRLLVETSIAHMTQMEFRLSVLSREIAHVETSKDKEEQSRIVAEIELMIATAMRADEVFVRELTRTDLNLLEKYNFESALKINQILISNLKAAETKVKAIKTN